MIDNLSLAECLGAVAKEQNKRRTASKCFGKFGTEEFASVAFEACLSDVIDSAFSIGMRVMHTQILLAALAVPLGERKLTAMAENPTGFGMA